MVTAPMGPYPACKRCGGDAGTLIDGEHTLCAALARRGLPTPSLGSRCYECADVGRTPRSRMGPVNVR
jgi:hypothetical protein